MIERLTGLLVLAPLALGQERAAPRDSTQAQGFRRALAWQDRGEGCSERFAFTAVWDAGHERVLVHAGEARREARFTFLQDLWQFTPRDGLWHELPTPVSPGGRAYHSAAYDAKRGAVWMFGGTGSDLIARDDLWRLDCASATWSRVECDGERPGPRFGGGLVLDPVRDQLVLWGGCKAFFQPDNAWPEVWSLDLTSLTWTRKASPAPARWLAASTLDPEAGLLIAQGGFDENSSPRAETWIYDLAHDRWSEAARGPKATEAHAAVWDPLARKAVFFGGVGPGRDGLAALWVFDPRAKRKAWSELEPRGRGPEGRAYHVATWLPEERSLWIFGGTANAFNDPPRSPHAWQIALHE